MQHETLLVSKWDLEWAVLALVNTVQGTLYSISNSVLKKRNENAFCTPLCNGWICKVFSLINQCQVLATTVGSNKYRTEPFVAIVLIINHCSIWFCSKFQLLIKRKKVRFSHFFGYFTLKSWFSTSPNIDWHDRRADIIENVRISMLLVVNALEVCLRGFQVILQVPIFAAGSSS